MSEREMAPDKNLISCSIEKIITAPHVSVNSLMHWVIRSINSIFRTASNFCSYQSNYGPQKHMATIMRQETQADVI